MAGIDDVKEGMEVIGADGAHVGTIDRIEGDRIKLTKKDSGQGSHEGHHHYLSPRPDRRGRGRAGPASADADVAVSFEEEEGSRPSRLNTRFSPSGSMSGRGGLLHVHDGRGAGCARASARTSPNPYPASPSRPPS